MKTNKEVVDIIRESGHDDWFDDLEAIFDFNHLNGLQVQKKGFTSIYSFVRRQVDGWSRINSENKTLGISIASFNSLSLFLDEILENAKNWDSNEVNQKRQQVMQTVNSFGKKKILTYDAPETQFLLNFSTSTQKSWEGAHDFLVNGNLRSPDLPNSEYLFGVIAAYEFKAKGSLLTKRRSSEKNKFIQLQNQLEASFQTSESDLKKHSNSLENLAKDKLALLDEMRNQQEKSYNDWFYTVSEKTEKFSKASSDQIAQLEQTYDDKLKLEKPAEYWDQRATELRKDGWKWLNWLIGFVIAGIALLFTLLILITSGDIENIFKNVGTAIKWSVVFITLMSFIAYGLRTFAKLAFSSFHLVRDAEERKHLVYVFLALSNEKQMDKEERHLIIQSIFSRADSGLLREDSSPTMPGAASIAERFMGGR